jgi:CMP-N-acetylneuraminic acid synthetase
MLKKKILIIIPVRLGSKRLKYKNILEIKGLPMFVLVAKEALKSKYNSTLYVSTESQKIINLCKRYKLNFIKRPARLALDNVEKQLVIVDAVKKLKLKERPEIVISLQANTPQFNVTDLDRAIFFFLKKVFPSSQIRELITIDNNNLQDGAFRIMTLNTVFKKTLSTKVGVYKTNYLDIHYYREYKIVKKKIEKS